MEIYYYSGTGNSLHVARELQKRIPTIELIPVVSLLDKDIIETTSETVGFVFPVYLSTVPVVVRNFVQKLDVKSASYIFAIATRCGFPGPCRPHIALERILKHQNKMLSAFFMLDMIDNSPTGLKSSFMPSNSDWINQIKSEKIVRMESEIQSKLDSIQKTIINRERYYQLDPSRISNDFVHYLMSLLIEYSTGHSKIDINYYADQRCTGCGLCENICLSKKIKMADKKPIWQRDIRCYYCYACFNFCPEQAILINNGKNSYKAQDGRYHHPEIIAKDIASQK